MRLFVYKNLVDTGLLKVFIHKLQALNKR